MNISAKPRIALEEIERRIGGLPLPEVDAVVAVERGGLTPGKILAAALDRPLGRIGVRYRDDGNTPEFDEPRVVGDRDIPVPPGSRLLLVDDVSVTGATLRTAAAALEGYHITTLVLKGAGDHVAFPEFDTCVTWPWTVPAQSQG